MGLRDGLRIILQIWGMMGLGSGNTNSRANVRTLASGPQWSAVGRQLCVGGSGARLRVLPLHSSAFICLPMRLVDKFCLNKGYLGQKEGFKIIKPELLPR